MKNYFVITLTFFGLILVMCQCEGKKETETSCINIDLVLKISKISTCYRVDSLEEKNHTLKVKLKLQNVDFFEPQAEREYMFYILSGLANCKNNNLDSIKVIFESEPDSKDKLIFPQTYNAFLANLAARDSLSAPYYHQAMSYFLKKDIKYRDLVTIFSHMLGAALNDDDDGMYNVDFFEFLLKYTNDVQQRKKNADTFAVLDELELKIKSSELLPEYKNEAIDLIKCLRNMRTGNCISMRYPKQDALFYNNTPKT